MELFKLKNLYQSACIVFGVCLYQGITGTYPDIHTQNPNPVSSLNYHVHY